MQRLTSTQTLTATRAEAETGPDGEVGGDLGPDFDLGFISHARFDTSLNHDVVRSVIFSPGWDLRLNYLHNFLVNVSVLIFIVGPLIGGSLCYMAIL